ncbi:MAG: exonuclease domain-containing protein [Anaerolineae bacterium]|nr:exonuclease domain-containing protein [Anaerolineae bacterium]
MTRRYDQIIVIDIECTCWEGKTPPDMEHEIIEIGICPLRPDTGERLERRSILVKPQRSTVSAFCTQLTSLTQEQVDQGIPFADACTILEKQYRTRQRVWASYGDYDRQQFERQCAAWGVPYPFSPSHLNVKTLFTLIRALRHDVGMAQALEIMQIPLEGRHHRGDDDAWNVAQMLHLLLNERREMPHNGSHG